MALFLDSAEVEDLHRALETGLLPGDGRHEGREAQAREASEMAPERMFVKIPATTGHSGHARARRVLYQASISAARFNLPVSPPG